MSASLNHSTAPFLFEDMPTPRTKVRDIGGLIIGPGTAARRLITAARDGFEDISGCISQSRTHDAKHDAHLAEAARLALRCAHLAAIHECPCGPRFQHIARQIKAAQAADDCEDSLIVQAWEIAKQMAGCIGKALSGRRARTGGQGR